MLWFFRTEILIDLPAVLVDFDLSLWEVDLIEENDAVAILRDFKELAVLIGRWPASIENEETRSVSLSFFRPFDTDLLANDVFGLSDTSAVSTNLRGTRWCWRILDNVTGGPFDIGNNGFFFAKKTLRRLICQRLDDWLIAVEILHARSFHGGQSWGGWSRGLQIHWSFTDDLSGYFFRHQYQIVDIDFNLGQGADGSLARVDEVRQGTIELFHGDVHSLVLFCADDVHDGFSLGQIDLTIQKGPLGKFRLS